MRGAAPLLLRLTAMGCLLAGLSHVIMGPTADMMLGAVIDAATLNDASLDSQNRFYGAAFTVYAAIFWIGASDVARYRHILSAGLLCFFFGGIARLVSMGLHGAPSALVIGLMASELLLPPLLWWMVRE
jgi:Domain of unknown function (DUF4345)